MVNDNNPKGRSFEKDIEKHHLEYKSKIDKLGETLREKLPQYEWKYDKDSSVWITYSENQNLIIEMFNSPQEWRKFLDEPNLITIFFDSESWLAFTID